MKGKVIIVVGARQHGKTTVVKDLISKVPNKENLMVYDHQQEYKEYYDKPFLPIKDFAEQSLLRRNSVVVYEEATIFISHFKDTKMTDLLVSTAHTGNTIILVFHSLRSLPIYIYDLGNFMILKKTMDRTALVESRFEDVKLLDAFYKLKESTDKYDTKYFRYA